MLHQELLKIVTAQPVQGRVNKCAGIGRTLAAIEHGQLAEKFTGL